MSKTYTKKQIAKAIAYWEKQLKTMNEEFDSINQIDIRDMAIENNSSLGKIASALLKQILHEYGGNKIDQAQFCSCKSARKLIRDYAIKLQSDIKNELQDNGNCFLIMHIKDEYNPADYDEDNQYQDNQAASSIINKITATTSLPVKLIVNGSSLHGHHYVIAAF